MFVSSTSTAGSGQLEPLILVLELGGTSTFQAAPLQEQVWGGSSLPDPAVIVNRHVSPHPLRYI